MAEEDKSTDIHRRKKRAIRAISWKVLAIATVLIIIVGLFTLNVSPFRAFGGAVWLKNGVHYISDAQISNHIEQLNAPKEAKIADKISSSTPSCDSLDEGFCQKTSGEYVYKTLITSAVAYKSGTPDRKEIIGYCTLCNDGTLSPSCAVGRGACSWHGGVASYNVPEYRTIPGTPAVQAQPAVYSYTSKTYKDSQLYYKPETPSLKAITGF
jgi:hypothetical protein